LTRAAKYRVPVLCDAKVRFTSSPEEENVGENEEGTQRGPEEQIVIVTDKGYITRTTLSEFRVAHRGTRGTRAMYLKEVEGTEEKDKGHTIAVRKVKDGDVVFVLTRNGQGALVNVDEIKLMGRGKSGVKLMTLEDGDSVVSVS